MSNDKLEIEELKARRKNRLRNERREIKLAGMSEEDYNAFLDGRAAKAREQRAGMSEEQREEYRRKSRERAKRAYESKRTIGKES